MNHTPAQTVTATAAPKRPFHTLIVFRAPTAFAEELEQLMIRRRMTSLSALVRQLLREGLDRA